MKKVVLFAAAFVAMGIGDVSVRRTAQAATAPDAHTPAVST
jgi:hypothetical protein